MPSVFFYLFSVVGEVFVNVDYGEESFIRFVNFVCDGIHDFIIAVFIIIGDNDIENYVCVGGAAYHPEIMEADFFVDSKNDFRNLCFHLGSKLVPYINGVHMDGCKAAGFAHYISLNVVDGIVDINKVSVGRNFRMEGDKNSSGAIVMNYHIVNSDHSFVGKNDFLNALAKLLVRGSSKKGIYGFFCGRNTGEHDEARNSKSNPAIDKDSGFYGKDCGKKNRSGGNGIGNAVHGGCTKSCGIDFVADGTVIDEHIELRKNRNSKDDEGECGIFNFFRGDDFYDGITAKLKTHHYDDHRNYKAGDIFKSSVAKRMVRVGFLGSKAEADKAYYRGTCVRKVVERIGSYRNGTAYKTCNKFSDEEEDVYNDSDDSAKIAIGGTNLGIFIVFAVFNKNF